MEVVRHDGEGMQRESTLVPITEEGSDHEFGIVRALEEPVPLVREDGDGVGAQLLAIRSHGRRAYPRG